MVWCDCQNPSLWTEHKWKYIIHFLGVKNKVFGAFVSVYWLKWWKHKGQSASQSQAGSIIWLHFFWGAVVMHHSSLYLVCNSTDGCRWTWILDFWAWNEFWAKHIKWQQKKSNVSSPKKRHSLFTAATAEPKRNNRLQRPDGCSIIQMRIFFSKKWNSNNSYLFSKFIFVIKNKLSWLIAVICAG